MTHRPRPSIRHCPICGVAMQASKSQENLANFDTFECLTCHTVIRAAKPRPAGTNDKPAPKGHNPRDH